LGCALFLVCRIQFPLPIKREGRGGGGGRGAGHRSIDQIVTGLLFSRLLNPIHPSRDQGTGEEEEAGGRLRSARSIENIVTGIDRNPWGTSAEARGRIRTTPSGRPRLGGWGEQGDQTILHPDSNSGIVKGLRATLRESLIRGGRSAQAPRKPFQGLHLDGDHF